MALVSVLTICSWPITSCQLCGLYLRYKTRFAMFSWFTLSYFYHNIKDMKNYSRKNAAKNKTTFRTGDKWRARKNIVVRDIKSMHQWKSRLPQKKSE